MSCYSTKCVANTKHTNTHTHAHTYTRAHTHTHYLDMIAKSNIVVLLNVCNTHTHTKLTHTHTHTHTHTPVGRDSAGQCRCTPQCVSIFPREKRGCKCVGLTHVRACSWYFTFFFPPRFFDEPRSWPCLRLSMLIFF